MSLALDRGFSRPWTIARQRSASQRQNVKSLRVVLRMGPRASGRRVSIRGLRAKFTAFASGRRRRSRTRPRRRAKTRSESAPVPARTYARTNVRPYARTYLGRFAAVLLGTRGLTCPSHSRPRPDRVTSSRTCTGGRVRAAGPSSELQLSGRGSVPKRLCRSAQCSPMFCDGSRSKKISQYDFN